MGYNLNTQKGDNQEYVKAVEEITRIISKKDTSLFTQYDFMFYRTQMGRDYEKCLKTLKNFTNRIIEDRLREFNETVIYNDGYRIAFLDVLIQAHLSNPLELTLNDLHDEVNGFLFAGHDTTSTSALWFFYAISQDLEIQNKIHEELDSILSGNKNEHISIDSLSKLKYLDCVIKESERLYTTAVFIARELDEDIIIENCKIPKGTTAQIFTYQIHRDERYYPEPEKFIPERFLPEKSANRPAYAYLPFSAGKRNCIGKRFAQLELKLLYARILSVYEIRCEQKRDEFKLDTTIVTIPSVLLLFKLIKRSY